MRTLADALEDSAAALESGGLTAEQRAAAVAAAALPASLSASALESRRREAAEAALMGEEERYERWRLVQVRLAAVRAEELAAAEALRVAQSIVRRPRSCHPRALCVVQRALCCPCCALTGGRPHLCVAAGPVGHSR